MLDSLWGLWHEVPIFGRKAAQFVDLLGYFLLKTPGLQDKKVSLRNLKVYLNSLGKLKFRSFIFLQIFCELQVKSNE